MKKFCFILLASSLIYGCILEKECKDFTTINIDSEVKKYFQVYNLSGEKYIFSDGMSEDTVTISAGKVGWDTVAFIGPSCRVSQFQGITFRGRNFVDTSATLVIQGNPDGTVQGTTLRFTSTDGKFFYFAILYDRTKNTFSDGQKNTIKVLDSLKTLNKTYYKVIEINNDIVNNRAFYFAEGKGLIRWINKNKTYDLKN